MEIDEWGNQSSHFIRVHLSKETTEQTEENKIIKDKKKKEEMCKTETKSRILIKLIRSILKLKSCVN